MPQPATISAEVFAAQARHATAKPVPVARFVSAEPNLESGALTNVVMSTPEEDRGRDTIAQGEAWRTANFEANPVLMWAHDYSTPPIGKVDGLEKGSRLIGRRIVFMDESLAPSGMPSEWLKFAMSVAAMYTHRERFLRAFSIGMMPHRWEYNEQRGGVDFLEQELLELSACGIPMNASCLSGAKDAGIDMSPWATFAEKRLDEDERAPAWLPVKAAALINRTLAAPMVQVPDMSALHASVERLAAEVATLKQAHAPSLPPAASAPLQASPINYEAVLSRFTQRFNEKVAAITGRITQD